MRSTVESHISVQVLPLLLRRDIGDFTIWEIGSGVVLTNESRGHHLDFAVQRFPRFRCTCRSPRGAVLE